MESYDLVVKNGRVMDPASRFDGKLNLGIRNGQLVTLTVDDISGAEEIDASGLVVSPGFIDLHVHPDGMLDGGIDMALLGVTTALGGNCGSLFNISKEDFEKLLQEKSDDIYDSMQYKADIDSLLRKVDEQGYPVNLAMLAGGWYLRLQVGARDKNQPADSNQIEQMVRLAEEAMQQGAFGISLGLAYVPGTSSEEVEALFAVAARYDGLAAVHQRYNGIEIPGFTRDAVAGEIELIEAARVTGCRLQISHISFHIAYPTQPYEDLFKRSLETIERARAEGIDVMADNFPFAFASAIVGDRTAEMLYSPQFRKITGLDIEQNVLIAHGPDKGKPLSREGYEKLRKNAPNTPLKIPALVSEDLAVRSTLPRWVMVCSDSAGMQFLPAQPFVLGEMVRERRMLSLMDALEKMTILPAQRIGLQRKGRIMAGADADLTLFDPAEINGSLQSAAPKERVQGLKYVIVNGDVVARNGEYEGNLPGKALRHQPWQ